MNHSCSMLRESLCNSLLFFNYFSKMIYNFGIKSKLAELMMIDKYGEN